MYTCAGRPHLAEKGYAANILSHLPVVTSLGDGKPAVDVSSAASSRGDVSDTAADDCFTGVLLTSDPADDGMEASGSCLEAALTSDLEGLPGRCELTAAGRLGRCVGGVRSCSGSPEGTGT